MPEQKSTLLGSGQNPDAMDDKTRVVQKWVVGSGMDPARYVVGPGSIYGPNNATPGNLRHPRPYITTTDGGILFGFPVGVESFRRTGAAQLGLHRVIGGKLVRGQTTHYEEGRIEMSGVFPGTSSALKMQACLEILTKSQRNGLRLYLPGVLANWLFVLPENWEFSHDAEDRTHSISYSITFVIIGIGGQAEDPHGKGALPNPGVKTNNKGKGTHIFVVKSGVQTFRQIAYRVYKNANLWTKLVPLNKKMVTNFEKKRLGSGTPSAYKLPTYRWPIGTKIRY
jgi:hypothetical protein